MLAHDDRVPRTPPTRAPGLPSSPRGVAVAADRRAPRRRPALPRSAFRKAPPPPVRAAPPPPSGRRRPPRPPGGSLGWVARQPGRGLPPDGVLDQGRPAQQAAFRAEGLRRPRPEVEAVMVFEDRAAIEREAGVDAVVDGAAGGAEG